MSKTIENITKNGYNCFTLKPLGEKFFCPKYDDFKKQATCYNLITGSKKRLHGYDLIADKFYLHDDDPRIEFIKRKFYQDFVK